jgi:SAM-dependent methyltransferase
MTAGEVDSTRPIDLRPDRYHRAGEFLIFEARNPGDFDWMESEIARLGYYEQLGPWGYGVDFDKTVLASMIRALGTTRFLELGCGDGSVLACAARIGIAGTGVDISVSSKERALPHIRDQIKLGDLLAIPDLKPMELICAFDLIEHISPNKIDAFLSRVVSLMEDGGLLFLNTPAFGDDRIFGLVHTYWLDEWKGEDKRSKLWLQFPCYDNGLPLMGHLVWADWTWWERLFERHGMRRLDDLERALHAKFDAVMSYSDARRSYFVLGKNVAAAREAELCERVASFDLDASLTDLQDLMIT